MAMRSTQGTGEQIGGRGDLGDGGTPHVPAVGCRHSPDGSEQPRPDSSLPLCPSEASFPPRFHSTDTRGFEGPLMVAPSRWWYLVASAGPQSSGHLTRRCSGLRLQGKSLSTPRCSWGRANPEPLRAGSSKGCPSPHPKSCPPPPAAVAGLSLAKCVPAAGWRKHSRSRWRVSGSG